MFPDKVSFYVAGLEDVDFQNEKGTAENSFTQYFNVYLVLNSSLGKFLGLQRLIIANILWKFPFLLHTNFFRKLVE